MGTLTIYSRASLRALLAALALMPFAALADSGVYVGGSIGNAAMEINELNFDENDDAYKAFMGYRFDLPAVFLGVEGGYANLGEPDLRERTGLNLFGIAGLEAGPIDLFVKAGYIAWNTDFVQDDSSDLGYGLGMAFGLGPLEIRGEYEMYDVEYVDVSMISVGFSYLFD